MASSLTSTPALLSTPTHFNGTSFSFSSAPTPIPRRRRSITTVSVSVSSAATRASNSSTGSALYQAAKHTVDAYIKNGMVIGLGSGQASGMAIQYLGQQLRVGALKDIVGIPMSVISASKAAKAGILLEQYQDSSQIDFAFDDPDVIEEETLIAVIGRRKFEGDESIIQQKSILNATNELVFMVTDKQYKGGLDGSIPVLVQSLNWMEAAEEIDDLFLGDAEVWRRPSIGQAGPMGGDFPVVTKEGLNILDVIFTSPIGSLAEVAESLAKVEGVVDHGLISKFPCTAVIASESGLCIVDNLQRKTVSDAL